MKKTTLITKTLLTLAFLLITLLSFSQSSQTFSSSGTFTVPAGVTQVTVEAWGAGGRGGSRSSNAGGSGGGGGGAYAKSVIAVTSGSTYNFTVGVGSTSSSPGGDSWFNTNTTILAKGGNSVDQNSSIGAFGGASVNCKGTFVYSGGNGKDGVVGSYGGGGGSSAGISLVGNNASSAAGAVAPSGGGNGGNGKSSSGGGGAAGDPTGGGGGGSFTTAGGTQTGGSGGNGQIILSYNSPKINLLGNSIAIPNNDTTPNSTDWTDFGSLDASSGKLIKTFTIQNTGNIQLTIGAITISGTNKDEFEVTKLPSATVPANSSTTFSITFDPNNVGAKTATISIVNNDATKNPYNFAIQGTGIQTFFDSDGDGVYDNVDIDDDNDGIKDITEELNCNNSNGHKVDYKFLYETFGFGDRTKINTTYAATTSYSYQDATTPTDVEGSGMKTDLNDGKYTVGSSAQIAEWADQYWYKGVDHTGNPNGRMAIFNASYTPGIFYTALITGALPNIPITYSFWVLNLDRTDAPNIGTRLKPNIRVEFRDINDNVLQTINTGSIPPTTAGNLTGNWQQFTANLTFTVNTFKVIFINNETGGIGNDLALDDILITQKLCDLDNDGVADVFDLDADNDGIPDVVEAGLGYLSNGKAKIDVTWVDLNGNGLLDSAEPIAAQQALDSDGDGIPNYIDLDSDNDSVFDVDESGAGNVLAVSGFENGDGDINGDGVGDGPESETFRSKDTNGDSVIEGYGDGILDIYDYGTGANQYGNTSQGIANANAAATYLKDTDGDGIPDYLDLQSTYKNLNVSPSKPFGDLNPAFPYDIDNNKLIYNKSGLDSTKRGVINTTTDLDHDGIPDLFDTNNAQFGSPRDLNTKLYLDFDGRNDYAQDDAVLTGSAGSLMAWIDLKSAGSGASFIVGQNSFHLRVTSSDFLEVYCNGKTITSPTALVAKRWYHAAAIYDGTNLNLYLNGTKIDTKTATGSIADATNLTIGRSPSSNSNFFKGKIDEVRVFNIGLTDNQVQRMVYQELDDTSGANLRGTYITSKGISQDLITSTATVSFSNMLRYYRMDTYKDDIIDNLTTPTIDLTGTKIYNHKNIFLQQAPMPFVTTKDGDLATAVTDATKDIVGTDVNNYSTIVKIKHNNTTTVTRTDIGLIVDAGKSLIVNGDSGLTNSWYLKLDGKIDLQGMSQLVQTTNSELASSTTGLIEKDQQGQSNNKNYNYWSSPVSAITNAINNNGYTVAGVMKDGTTKNTTITPTWKNISWVSGYDGSASSPITLSRYWLYKFESATDTYANWVHFLETDVLRAGQSFTLKGSGTAAATQNYTFVGKPNNGTISNPITANNLFLVGNPYPSALDANQFITDNILSVDRPGGTDGTLYFWEHDSNNNSHVLANYLGGYAAYNLVGGLPAVMPSGIGGIGTGTKKTPKRYITVGQGFFVYGTAAGGNVVFNNRQRVFAKETDGTSNALFRTKAPSINSKVANQDDQTVTVDKYKKIRLGYNTNNGYHRQVLLGFMDEKATSGIDYGYDGEILDDFPNDMFLLNGDVQLAIEGEGFFDENASYPIGVKSDVEGKVSFTIDALENFDAQQKIYLYDDDAKTYNEIQENHFEVILPVGSNDTRFSLRFIDKSATPNETLSVDENIIKNDIKIAYAQDSHTLKINNNLAETLVEKVTLYNINGQSIATWKIENQNQQDIQIPINSISSGVYIAKLKTSTGELSKKIIVN